MVKISMKDKGLSTFTWDSSPNPIKISEDSLKEQTHQDKKKEKQQKQHVGTWKADG